MSVLDTPPSTPVREDIDAGEQLNARMTSTIARPTAPTSREFYDTMRDVSPSRLGGTANFVGLNELANRAGRSRSEMAPDTNLSRRTSSPARSQLSEHTLLGSQNRRHQNPEVGRPLGGTIAATSCGTSVLTAGWPLVTNPSGWLLFPSSFLSSPSPPNPQSKRG